MRECAYITLWIAYFCRSGTEIVGPTKGKKYLQHFWEPKSVETTKELQTVSEIELELPSSLKSGFVVALKAKQLGDWR